VENMNVMNMSPNDYIRAIEKKEAEIQRLQKIVAELTENIRIVGKQNAKLKKKCDRYEKRLSEMYLNGDFE
jgi:predicted RNase H-like nuclease (RuvC/YqgF family)